MKSALVGDKEIVTDLGDFITFNFNLNLGVTDLGDLDPGDLDLGDLDLGDLDLGDLDLGDLDLDFDLDLRTFNFNLRDTELGD